MQTIEQCIVLPAAPTAVYEALMDSKQHATFTKAPATVSREVGGAFSCHDGMISGLNVDLVPGERIVQAWRAAHFPPGVFSLVTFTLKGDLPGKTRLELVHTGVPDEAAESISKGWVMHYWDPMKTYLGAK